MSGGSYDYLEFAACWPEHPRTKAQIVPWDRERKNYVRLRRTVRVDRPARTVARELPRHTLTPYEALYSEAWGEHHRDLRHERETESFADDLVALGGERLTRERPTVSLWRIVLEATGDGVRPSRVGAATSALPPTGSSTPACARPASRPTALPPRARRSRPGA